MIVGIGVDIADNSRFEKLEEGVKARIFTPYEIEESGKAPSKAEYLASRFAAKEAFSKALGSGFDGILPRNIEIRQDGNGKPYIALLSSNGSGYKTHLSISHERAMSVAMVVLEDGTL